MITKEELFAAFAMGRPIVIKGRRFAVLNKLEREDGSNQSYNVSGILEGGRSATIWVSTKPLPWWAQKELQEALA